jgi:predicted Zn finger-like uncharacterized protein
MEINTYEFEGWIIECPHCKEKDYVSNEDISFNPNDDLTHIVSCNKCGKEFEVFSG